jgi:signal peptidase II
LEAGLKKIIWSYALLAGMAGLIVVVDQWTKALVRANLAIGEIWSPWTWLTPYARIVNWNNTGAAFGIFQGFSGVFSLLAIIVALVIIYYFPRVPAQDWVLRIAMGLQLGGALGNLVDRITIGRVTDFISVGSFAVFNVADSSITVGVIILVLGVWLKDQHDKKEERTLSANQPARSGENDLPVQGEGDHLE